MNFKKVLCLNLAVLSIFMGTFFTAGAQEPEAVNEAVPVQDAELMAIYTKTYDNITYELDESSSTATVVGIGDNVTQLELKDTVGNTHSGAEDAYKSYKITAIADRVGNGHEKLTYVKLNGATNLNFIGENCFSYCPKLERVDFASSMSSLQSIGNNAFYYCPVLDTVNYTNVQSKLTDVGSSVLGLTPYMDNQTAEFVMLGNTLVKYNGSSTSIVLPSNITGISDAFFGKDIVSINLGNVATVGNNAFYGCKKLERVVLPSTCTRVGDMAFAGCTSLKSVEYLGKLTSIGFCSFANCSSLESFTYGGSGTCSLTDIGECAFWNDRNLRTLEVGVIENVNVGAFWNCFSAPTEVGNVRYYKLPMSVKSIADGGYGNLLYSYVAIPNDLTSIASTAFGSTNGTSYVVHKGTNVEEFFKNSAYSWINYGDVNADEKINAKDIKRVAEYIAMNIAQICTNAETPSEQDVLNYDSGKGVIADFDGDGNITTTDLYEIFSSIRAEYEAEQAAE